MKNREIEQEITNAFEYTTPNMLDSILADCKSLNREVKPYRKHITSWNIKMACTTAAAILVVCFVLGLGGILDIGSLISHYSTGSQNMIIQYSKESCIAIEDNCFYAKGKKGELYLVRWQDTQELYEGQLVEVSYDTVEKLEYPDGYPSGWTPKYEITATSVNTYGETIHGQGDGTMCIYAETIGEIKNGVSYAIDHNGKIWKILISERTHLDLPAGDTDSGWIYLNGVTELDAPEKGATYQAASVRIKYNGAEFEDDPSRNPVLTNDLVRMDFDGDGNEEICVLAMGPTSGLMTMQIAIYNLDGSIKYDSIFVVHYDSANTAFFVKDGKLYMIGCCALRYNSNTSLVSGWGYLAIQVALVDGKLKLLDSTGAEWGSIWDGYPVDPEPTEPLPTDPPSTEFEMEYPYAVDWQMAGYVVSSDGTLRESMPVTIKGDIEKAGKYVYLNLDIEPSQEFAYLLPTPDPNGWIGICQGPKHAGDFITSGFAYSKHLNEPKTIVWAISVEKQCLIIYYGQYLVASTDPGMTSDEIMEHFRYFVDLYHPDVPQPTDPQPTEPLPTDPAPTDPAPTEPAPTEPEGFPANMNTDEKVVQKFQKLFDNGSWFTQALNEEFDDPRTINLVDFLFPGGGDDPWPTFDVTKEEMEEVISKTGPRKEWESGWYRMDAKTVEEVLQTVFGVTFSEFINSADKYLRYLESTDSYYVGRSDCSLVSNVSVAGIRQLENGNIEVYYTCKWLYPHEGVVTLKPIGDSYIVISNKGL